MIWFGVCADLIVTQLDCSIIVLSRTLVWNLFIVYQSTCSGGIPVKRMKDGHFDPKYGVLVVPDSVGILAALNIFKALQINSTPKIFAFLVSI